MNARGSGSTGPAKPRVFIGSSTEAKEVASNLGLGLEESCEPVLWHAGAFTPGESYLESLEKNSKDVEFAVLIATPDDSRTRRGADDTIPRDNVIFELGLFMGRLGRRRTFLVYDHALNIELPTDLLGVNTINYQSQRRDGNLEQAVNGAVTRIKRSILQEPRLLGESAAKPLVSALLDEDAVYGAVVEFSAASGDTVVVQTADTRWVWDLVPTLLHWRTNGVRTRVFVPPGSDREEIARRAFLAEIGVEVKETADHDLAGYFLKTNYPTDDVAIVLNQPDDLTPLATRYEGTADPSAVKALHRYLRHFDDGTKPDADFKPTLEAQDPQEVMDLLKRGVRQYRPAEVELQAASLPTNDLLLMTPYARAYKLKQIGRLFDTYAATGQPPFTSLAVRLRSGKKWLLTSPVVEKRREGLVVMEGTTRAAYCSSKGIKNYLCITVQGVEDDLPGTPVPIASVTTSERSLTFAERTADPRRLLFRHIQRATHPY